MFPYIFYRHAMSSLARPIVIRNKQKTCKNTVLTTNGAHCVCLKGECERGCRLADFHSGVQRHRGPLAPPWRAPGLGPKTPRSASHAARGSTCCLGLPGAAVNRGLGHFRLRELREQFAGAAVHQLLQRSAPAAVQLLCDRKRTGDSIRLEAATSRMTSPTFFLAPFAPFNFKERNL